MKSKFSAMTRALALSGIVLCGGEFGATSALAAPEGGLSIELSKVEDVGGICRLSYVVTNGTTTALDQASYEVVVFDRDQTPAQFVILDFDNLPIGKTKVYRFDIQQTQCASISRLLINNATNCTSVKKPSSVCLDALAPKTRTAIAFGQ